MKEGYKKYEFGIIPDYWMVKKIGDLYLDLKAGATPSRSKVEYFKGDIPWITSGELKSKFIYNTYEKITEEAVESANLKIYPKGTFFIAITGLEAEGTRGSCGINNINATTNQSCLAFREIKEVNTEYLYYWYILYGDFIGLKYTQGTKQQSLNNKIVEGLEFAYPPLKEQQKIAEILSTVDSQIDDTDKIIEKTKELKKGLMQSLLTKGIGHKEFKKTDIGYIPIKWDVKSINEVCEIVDYRGKTPKKVKNGVFLVTAKNIGKGFIDYAISKEYIDEKDYQTVMSRGVPKVGDVLFTTEAPLGNVASVDNPNIALAQRVIKFSDSNGLINNYYLKYYMLGETFQKSILNEATGSTVKGIKGSRLKNILIAIPTLDEQGQIVNILSVIDNEIEKYESKKAKLEELKKGLMQQLLTGKIRVV